MSEFSLPHDHGEQKHLENLYREVQKVEHFSAVCEIFKQLSDPTRVRIFWLLSHHEECVINIAAMLDMSSPAVSHHLRSLTQARLIVSRRSGKEVYYRAADTAQIKLLHEIVEQVMEIACPEQVVDFQSSQEEIIRHVHDELTENLSERVTIEALSKKYLMNTTTLKRVFKEVYGETIAAHMKQHRMEAAASLLLKTQDDIASIAQAVGYESQSRFTAVFKETYGELPTEYRRRHCGASAAHSTEQAAFSVSSKMSRFKKAAAAKKVLDFPRNIPYNASNTKKEDTAMRYRLKNAQVLQGGVFHSADVFVSDGKIVSIGDAVSCCGDTVSIDLHNMVLFPGFVDVHVHLREPGFSYKETILTGTMAAAHGGFTHVACMPNLAPVPDSREHLAVQLDAIRASAKVHVIPYGAISVGEKGEELAALSDMAPDVIAFSDDGKGVQSEAMMREAMTQCRRLGKILAAHCEDNTLLRGGYIHDGAYARAHGHRGICSESEWGQVARDLKLAEETGCAYHVCHVSTKESVALIREAKRRGVNVTCETGPHYLVFTEDDLQEDGRFKMNPPVREKADREALIEGLLDGTIDMIVTDHAPHSLEEKSRGLEKSAMGVVGLETSFAACYTHLVKTGILSLEKLVDLMHGAPMRRFGLGTELAVGQSADLTVFDLNESYLVDPAKFLTMGRATPFEGCELTGVCKLTMVNGEIVWKEESL